MGYLQLAENNLEHLAEVPAQYMDLYVFIPEGYRGATKDMYIREDVLDNLSPDAYARIMGELSDYQNTGLSDAASRAARKAQREKNAADRNTRKNTRSTAAATRQAARTERQALRSQNKGKGGAGKIFGGILDTAKDIFGKGNVDVQAGGGDFSVDYSGSAPEESFFSKNKVWLIGGGVLLVGGIVWYTMKKK
jgi:hypothetical protein